MRLIDLTGKRFGRLVALSRFGTTSDGEPTWLFRCDCGRTVVVRGRDVRSGHTKSCGCLGSEQRSINGRSKTKHGMSGTRLYGVWRGMKKRCYCRNHPHFKDYGGRGITVCAEWKDDFSAFAKWAIGNGYDDHAGKGECTLDRIDPDKGYSPDNCRFSDMVVQQNNRRDRRNSIPLSKDSKGVYHAVVNCGARIVEVSDE